MIVLAATLLALTCAPGWAQGGREPPGLSPDTGADIAAAQRWLSVLRTGSPAERQEAMQGLSKLGVRARAVLEQAQDDPDPDVRFNVLLLLNEPSGALARLIRQVVVGEGPNAPCTERALAAYYQIVGSEADLTQLMIRLIRKRAAVRTREANLRDRTLLVALSALRDQFQAPPAGMKVGREHARQVVALLELDLGGGLPELVTVLQALPPSEAFEALAARARVGPAAVRARAARALAEVATRANAAEAAPIAVSLLTDANPTVRRAGLECLDMLALPKEALLPIVPLVQDKEPAVRAVALRVAGERGLGVVREVAESIAGDGGQPAKLRMAALRALGLLGAGSPRLLSGLARGPQRELAVLAAWAFGCQGTTEARDLILELLANPELQREERLYFGLSRVGGEVGTAALAGLLAFPKGRPPSRAQRILVVRALGFVRGGQEPAARALAEIAGRPAVGSNQPGPTSNEIQAALKGFAELGGAPARLELAQTLVMPRRASEIGVAISLVLQVGGPEDGPARQRLVQVLERVVNQGAAEDRAPAAHALARVDPARAMQVLRGQLRRAGPSDIAREYARALARAGDPGEVDRRALPYSRERMREAGDELLSELLNAVGIDLLYAGRNKEAVAEFQRMLWCRPSDEIAAYNMACGYARMGKIEPALHYLRRSVMHGYRKYRHIRSDTDLGNLHGDPRFERILLQLRLVEETQVFSERTFFGWSAE